MTTTVTIRNDTTLALIECYLCGVQFGMTERMHLKRYEDGKSFYCPNGHGQTWVVSEADKLRNQLAQSRDRELATSDQLESERRGHAATKGQLTKTRKRIAGGVCPCCKRSFTNLTRHMAGQHPDYGGEEAR
jgi:hypothetical protein